MDSPGIQTVPPIPDAFETRRLRVRSPMPGDGAALVEAVQASLEELRPWMEWAQQKTSVEETEERCRQRRSNYLDRSDLGMSIFERQSGLLIGGTGLHRMNWSVPRFEIGYWRRTGFGGQGYITEVVQGLTALAFEHLGAQRVEIRCDPRNEPSRRVAERVGYSLEGELRNEARTPDGGLRNTLVFSLIPEEYERLKMLDPEAFRITVETLCP